MYWVWKPKDIIQTLKAYDTIVQGSPLMQQVVRNMESIERRSLDQDENTTKTNRNNYKQYIIYSYYLLDDATDPSPTQARESLHITNQMKVFGAELKAALLNRLFLAALRDTLAYSDKLTKAVFEPNRGVNLTTFIQSCNISVQSFIAFTDFTIADNVPILRRILADNGTSAPKYPLTPIKPSYAPGFTPA